jgi:hypothetical protein
VDRKSGNVLVYSNKCAIAPYFTQPTICITVKKVPETQRESVLLCSLGTFPSVPIDCCGCGLRISIFERKKLISRINFMTKKRLSIVQLRKDVGHEAQARPAVTEGINKVLAKRKALDVVEHDDVDEHDDDDGDDNDDVDDDDAAEDDEDDDSDGDSDDAATNTASKTSVVGEKVKGHEEGQPKKKACTAAPVPGGNQTNEFCNDRTVYIEGLPYASTEADISTFFESCGRIESVRLPRWQDSGRLRGYGHVQFATAAAAKRAIDELDGQ